MIKAVDSLGIVVTEDVSEDDCFDFFTLHSVGRELIQLLLFQGGEKTLHTGNLSVKMPSFAKPITEEILRLRELQAQTAMDDNAKTEHKKRIRVLLKFIERQKSKDLVFGGSLVKKLLEKVTVYDDYPEFRFKSGVTVSVEK